MTRSTLIRLPPQELVGTCLAAARSRHGSGCHWHPFTTVSPLRYPAGLLFSDSMVGCSAIGERAYFFDPEAAAPCMERNGIRRYAMEELLDPSVLPKYHPRVNADLL